jgi:hypothetical protein
MLAQTVDATAHGLAVSSSGDLEAYTRETVSMLERYLTP